MLPDLYCSIIFPALMSEPLYLVRVTFKITGVRYESPTVGERGGEAVYCYICGSVGVWMYHSLIKATKDTASCLS